MGKSLIPPGSGDGDGDGIEPVDLKKALEERYLAYALSTIMHRALPDVRDGMKPVHRRIVHAMRLLRLNPDQRFAKCASIVGEVMGKFHPHGDQSIYDALVRLAQPFSVRYPLVDGQGNFGNIDGDNAAAMRYTEARMTEAATELLSGITEDAVDFRATYNEENEEPTVLPGAFPNLLANGSTGIAVGMATSIPPHNVAELCKASLHLIDHPDASVEDLLTQTPHPEDDDENMVRGPDFPTGGIIVDRWETIVEAYKTGRGSFRVRAHWTVEDQGRGTWQIVVTEIPYGVQKAKLIEKIAELLIARKLPLLEDIRDESAEDIRVVLVPKSRSVDPAILMESLFKLSELENRFSLNMNVLSRGRVPNIVSLKEALQQWLDHRKEVLVRRSRHRLAEIERRLEILGGYLIAYLNIDDVIRIIREEDEPKQVMMARWDLTDVQAEAILNLRLRALRKLEEFEIRKNGFKQYSSLASSQTTVDALRAIRADHGIRGEDVASVLVRTTNMVYVHCGWPYEPKETITAQMNLPYTGAVTLLEGTAFIDQYTDDKLRDPKIIDLANRIKVVVDPELDAGGPHEMRAVRVTVTMKSGQEYHHEQTYRSGHWRNPISDADLSAKFKNLAGRVLKEDAVEGINAMVQGLDTAAEPAPELGRMLQDVKA